MSKRKKVVIVGGGFAGLAAAKGLRRADVDITLIDKRNFHLFQPLLYQVATGGLSPANIAAPLRSVLAKQGNARVLQAEVDQIDVARKEVRAGRMVLPYDYLIVATGAGQQYFGNDQWERHAPSLKTLEDAVEIRRRVLEAFERAEVEKDSDRRRAMQTFVVIGGGATGVEMAGALAELAHHTLDREFHLVDPRQSRILLIEGRGQILSSYHETLSERAVESLRKLGVEVMRETKVECVDEFGITLSDGSGAPPQRIDSETVIWAAGVKGSPLGQLLAEATGCELDSQRRVMVSQDLSIPADPNIFVLGDLAHFPTDNGPLPGVAPVAMQQGAYVAKLLKSRLRGKSHADFRYKDLGSMAVIGRNAAVAEMGRLRLHGMSAWFAWLFIHLINLVKYESRLLVLIQWGWNYVTRNRSARLITGDEVSLPDRRESAFQNDDDPRVEVPETELRDSNAFLSELQTPESYDSDQSGPDTPPSEVSSHDDSFALTLQ